MKCSFVVLLGSVVSLVCGLGLGRLGFGWLGGDMVEQKSKLPTGLEGIHSLTMSRFTLQLQKHSGGTGDFTLLINSVTIACKVVESCVRRAGIAKLYGLAGDQNVQGEDQKKLDIIANDAFKDNLIDCKQVAVMVSEEDDLAIVCDQSKNAKYAIAFDPLDGSSNIDANVSIGTIFAIYRIPDGAVINTPDDAAKVIMQVGERDSLSPCVETHTQKKPNAQFLRFCLCPLFSRSIFPPAHC